MSYLVIVESPSKASTIKGYLGSNYKVVASVGHVRDLPKSSLGVDIEAGFVPHYINIRGRGEIIKELKKEAKNASHVFLATDPDREGEAISWHLSTALDIPESKTSRITFNEVTKTAVKAAIKNPRQINMDLVNSQQTRRILDRIVGYKISPMLWKTVKSGLSAGRVQSVATRIIVEREEEIRNFKPSEYWTIDAVLVPENGKPFTVHFFGDRNGKIRLECEADAMKVVNAVNGKPFTVESVKKGVKHKAPAPPFTTSSMLQEASRKLGFQSSRIMKVAQELYEGINLGSEFGGTQGLITYMRTDSQRISSDAQDAARDFIKAKYGDEYYPASPRIYKTESGAQDAHEAIRPARVDIEPLKIKKNLTSDQFRLYKLIWERFVASQMQSAELSTVTADFENNGYIFRTSGFTVTFPGYMALYEESEEENDSKSTEPGEEKNIKLPALDEGQKLSSDGILPEKHFTEPPARYNEASLIEFLKKNGIGRPSTYTPIITTIISRDYVKREGKALVPTKLGEVTTEIMRKNFPDIIDYKFTAKMEDDLDAIEKGEVDMNNTLSEFWKDFCAELEEAKKNIGETNVDIPPEETDIICEKCGSKMVIKNGRFGKFAACPNYPRCKNTKPLEKETQSGEDKAKKELIVADFKCEKCGGDMVLRSGKFGSFYACANYPKCSFTKQKTKSLGVKCPKCGSDIIIKNGKNKTVFYSCEKYPECDFSSWDMPLDEKCPKCGKMLFRKKGKALAICHDPECGFSRPINSESGSDAKDNQ